ncbi:MAG: hypothetical protein LBN36_00840 [Clostridiales Family XIII bacterium]|nr:hypothetical protein [Clostridiales Family XIII bacterium]
MKEAIRNIVEENPDSTHVDKYVLMEMLDKFIETVMFVSTGIYMNNDNNAIIDYVDEEFETVAELIKYYEGRADAFMTIWSMLDDGMFDVKESEASDECKNNCYL